MESDYKLKTLKRSTIAIASVVIVEAALGLAVNSLAIISDGLHALLDAMTMTILFVATRESLKPPDEEHMYGHEKFESIGGFVGGLALIIVALIIFYEAALKILHGQNINAGLEYVGFIAIGFTFCIDFFRVGTLMKARRSESTTLKAGFYHALADLSSTIIAFLGFGLATLGLYYGDSMASIVLGTLLTYLSVKLVWGSAKELTDTIPKDVAEQVRKTIVETKGVSKLDDLKIRKAGEKMYIRASIEVPDYLNIEGAHDLASKVEANIKNMLGNAEIAIHTEPCRSEMSTEKLVETLAAEVYDVRRIHEISAAQANGRLYITLHAEVDPKITVERAHEIAERIEDKIKTRIKEVEDIAVHMEPFSPQKRRGLMVNEEEIRSILYKTAGIYPGAVQIKRIVTYVSGKKRHLNIDCTCTKQLSLEDAHKIASQIEENLKEHFAETTIVVHMEPR